MHCVIYKGSKKPDHYLYVEAEGNFSRVPEALMTMLGTLERVMSVELSETRKLAQADIVAVMRQLKESGYYLQLPPRRDVVATRQ